MHVGYQYVCVCLCVCVCSSVHANHAHSIYSMGAIQVIQAFSPLCFMKNSKSEFRCVVIYTGHEMCVCVWVGKGDRWTLLGGGGLISAV